METRFISLLFLLIIASAITFVSSSEREEQSNATKTLLENANSTDSATAVEERTKELKKVVKQTVEHTKEGTTKRDVPVKDEVNLKKDDEPTVPMDSKPLR